MEENIPDKSLLTELDEQTLRYVEEVGSFFEKYGGLKTLGRIIGLLQVSERPLNAEEMAEALKISRSGISTNLQMAQATRMVRTAPRRLRGERREYFEIAPGTWENLFLEVENKARGLQAMARSGLKVISPTNTTAQIHLNEMKDLSEFWLDWLDGFEETWHNYKLAMQQPVQIENER